MKTSTFVAKIEFTHPDETEVSDLKEIITGIEYTPDDEMEIKIKVLSVDVVG